MKTEKEAPFLFKFKNKKVRKAVLLYAVENETSIQKIIEDALASKLPKLIKP